MNIRKMCRGFGAAYIEIKVTGPKKIAVKSSSGNDLPFATYNLDNTPYIAMAIPLLDAKSFVIRLTDSDGRTEEKNIGAKSLKWISRLNYKLRNEATRMIRDIDRLTFTQQIHINPQIFIEAPGKSEFICKGVVCQPGTTSQKANLRLIDSEGATVRDASLHVGKETVSSFHGVKRVETSFTARIPKDGRTYCLVSDSQDSRTGFLCFDKASIERLLSECCPLMYRASSPDSYKARTTYRNRLIGLIDSSDYSLPEGPLFSIVVPLYKTPIPFLREMLASVKEQVYPKWELILVNSTPEDKNLKAELASIGDSRISVTELESNLGIAENTNVGIEAAKGDYVVFFDHDDTLDPFALYKYAKQIIKDPQIDVLYCDEDFLNEEGEYIAPHFKSDFNLDLLRCHNYITHLLAVKAPLAKDLMLRKEFDGAQDYDFLLRLVERTTSIVHVEEVLYHWRISDTSTAKSSGNKNYADEAGRKALQAHYDRIGLDAKAELTNSPCFYHTSINVQGSPLVSIIIPNKDSVEVLSRCIDSIYEKTNYGSFEIVIVENNSTDQETFDYYEKIEKEHSNLKVVTWPNEFNYSAINNFGIEHASGEYFLLLNNDTEVIAEEWMESMLAHCQREEVGAVGAKLLFPDDTVQHAGVMMIKCQNVNEIGGPIHVFSHLDKDDPGYMRRASLTQDLSVVTAACMMTKRSVYEKLNGLAEQFEVAFNDVDYCLRVRDLGLLVVFDPDALLYHYESFSRGYDTSGKNAARFIREQGKLRTAWSKYYVKGDPYHKQAATLLSVPVE